MDGGFITGVLFFFFPSLSDYPTMPYYQGYDSLVALTGRIGVPVVVSVTKWSVHTKVDEVDITTTNSLGFVNYQDGVADADITIEGVLGNLITDDPAVFLNVRALYAEIHIGCNMGIVIVPSNTITPASAWSFRNALITGWNTDNSVRDVVRWSLMAKGRNNDFNASTPPQWVEPR